MERDLLDSFKQFTAAEKLRMSKGQQPKKREPKTVKLSDLKRYPQGSTPGTPVPQDFVPILAKDEKNHPANPDENFQEDHRFTF